MNLNHDFSIGANDPIKIKPGVIHRKDFSSLSSCDGSEFFVNFENFNLSIDLNNSLSP